jgi:serine/threonine protein kinase
VVATTGGVSPETAAHEGMLDTLQPPVRVDGDTALEVGEASLRRPRGPDTELARGEPLGRHIVLERLGAGGMGVVYAAYDPELDRKIAVKLIRGLGADRAGAARLLREAKAMARLTHPNVITVHDVGVLPDGQVFVAMEFVDGLTLHAWQQHETRSWQEILAVYREAGRGLAAAHAVGLVHRDF